MVEFFLGAVTSLQLVLFFESLGIPSYWAVRIPVLALACVGLIFLILALASRHVIPGIGLGVMSVFMMLLTPQAFGIGFVPSLWLVLGIVIVLFVGKFAWRQRKPKPSQNHMRH